VIEVLVLAQERGGSIVREILEDLVSATTRDIKLLDEIDTESLESRINARAVMVLPWLVLVALTARPRRLPDFYRSPGGVVTLLVAGVLTAVGVIALGRLAREPVEVRPFATEDARDGGHLSRRGRRRDRRRDLAAIAVPPTPRLAPARPAVRDARPARARLAGAHTRTAATTAGGGAMCRLFGPPLRALARRMGRLTSTGGDEAIVRLLRQAGRRDLTPDDYLVQQLRDALLGAALGGAAVAILLHAPVARVGGRRRRLRRQVDRVDSGGESSASATVRSSRAESDRSSRRTRKPATAPTNAATVGACRRIATAAPPQRRTEQCVRALLDEIVVGSQVAPPGLAQQSDDRLISTRARQAPPSPRQGSQRRANNRHIAPPRQSSPPCAWWAPASRAARRAAQSRTAGRAGERGVARNRDGSEARDAGRDRRPRRDR